MGRIQANDVEHDLLQKREILLRVVLADSAAVLAETDIEDPVKPVFHAPVGTRSGSQLFGGQDTRADVVAPLQS